MSNKRKKNQNRSRLRDDRDRLPPPVEDQRSVAVTVAWMMATLATAAALALAGGAYVLTRSLLSNAGQPNPLTALPGLLLFIAVVTGILTLLLIPVVYRVRTTPPPSTVTIGSACIAVSPWIIVLVRGWV